MMIAAEGLTKRYGAVLALDHVSFTIEAGESVALWGANGAGKTTTLRCLLGVQSFDGQLNINGIDVRRDAKRARAAIGYVPQETAFYDLTVWETLCFFARLKKAPIHQVEVALEQVQLNAQARKRVAMLSGGMKQRLALAAALLADPPILVLDEPTANLDVSAQRDFTSMIQRLNSAGKTIVFSSHRLDEVMALAKRVFVLSEGRLSLECAPHDLVGKLGLQRWLRIWVAGEHKENSLRLLQESGYTSSPNGHTIYVRLPQGSKMTPLRALEAANIPVEDFELVDNDPTHGSAS